MHVCALPGYRIELAPAAASLFQIRLRRVEEKHQRRCTRETVKLMVVRVAPVERAVGFYLHARIQSDWIVVLKLALHGARAWHDSLPYALACASDAIRRDHDRDNCEPRVRLS
jgi:hypothetical protein